MILVGTSGWQYRDWRRRFYPADLPTTRWLEHYAARFATVEINNTFYRLPPATTFEQWAARVPADFVITVKASAYLTHRRRLTDPDEPVARLLRHAQPLGARLGPVLVQVPPNLRAVPDRLEAMLRAFGGRVRVAFEARHDSWFTDEVCAVLRQHHAALCLADRGSRPVTPLWRTASWAYLRMHAGAATPHPCYGRHALTAWVRRLRDLWGDQVDGYVYFNNDAKACAVRDAIAFAAIARVAGLEVGRVADSVDVAAG